MWGRLLEDINEELGDLIKLEKQMINNLKLAGILQALRRDVILCTAGFCKFEQELQKELEYGKNEYGGTGMGLAICKRIAEHHNGSITINSTPGAGITFHVSLPKKQTPLSRGGKER